MFGKRDKLGNSHMQDKHDFFKRYLEITSGTEVPTIFRRWSILGALGAWLGKETYLMHGDYKIWPTLYIMLLGVPGTRKTSAIKRAKKFLQAAGYDSFAAQKTTKEKFLMDLAGVEGEEEVADGFLDVSLGNSTNACMISADEFSDFFAADILNFVSLLGVLWDWEGEYSSRIKNGVSIKIEEPTISILSGNTQTTFAATFPPEVVGQGFFSRLIAVYASPVHKKITFPKRVSDEDAKFIVDYLHNIKAECVGEMEFTAEAKELLDTIYKEWKPIPDPRFDYYGNRRLTHLLKLTIIHTAARLSKTIECQDICHANTILAYTEHFMPRAFGEFGKAKNAGASHKVLDIIESSDTPLDLLHIWKLVSNDLNSLDELSEIVRGLSAAGKIQLVDHHFLPKKAILEPRYDEIINFNYLTEQEIKGE